MHFPYIKPGQPMAILRHVRLVDERAIQARARADRRTKDLARRIHPGEIAVIDHIDLDGPAAEALVARRVAAVINAAPSISGRYPNRGPEVLQAAGIPLVDSVGIAFLEQIHEGEEITVRGGDIFRDDTHIGSGHVMTPERLQQEIATAREHLNVELRRFVSNTLSYVEQESGLLFEAASLPAFHVDVRDRHVLVVVRGEGARQDLATLRGYLRNRRPVLIGVDGGADFLRELGFRPDIIFGDMDSISDECLLHSGAQLIVHAYADGRCPGKARLDRLGLSYDILPGRGTSEDVILLAAYEKGADLLTAVGTHSNLIDFLDKSRSGMSSTFLVRLRIGSRLVDVKGVSRLYHTHYPLIHFLVMVLTTLTVVAIIVMLSSEVQSVLQLLLIQVQHWLDL